MTTNNQSEIGRTDLARAAVAVAKIVEAGGPAFPEWCDFDGTGSGSLWLCRAGEHPAISTQNTHRTGKVVCFGLTRCLTRA